MIDFELEVLDRAPACRLVLEAYEVLHAATSAANPEADGWVDRVRSVEGVEQTDLSRHHGKLIALGLLRIEIAGRKLGLRYQVSPLGRRVLLGQHAIMPSVDEGDADEAQGNATARAA